MRDSYVCFLTRRKSPSSVDSGDEFVSLLQRYEDMLVCRVLLYTIRSARPSTLTSIPFFFGPSPAVIVRRRRNLPEYA